MVYRPVRQNPDGTTQPSEYYVVRIAHGGVRSTFALGTPKKRLKSLMEHSEKLSTVQFAGLFIDCIIEFAQERPAYLSLDTAPIRFRRDPAARKALRTIVGNAFRTKNPSLSSERSLLAANVAVQIVKGMIAFFLESDAKTKPLVVAEFRRVLTSYLEEVLAVT